MGGREARREDGRWPGWEARWQVILGYTCCSWQLRGEALQRAAWSGARYAEFLWNVVVNSQLARNVLRKCHCRPIKLHSRVCGTCYADVIVVRCGVLAGDWHVLFIDQRNRHRRRQRQRQRVTGNPGEIPEGSSRPRILPAPGSRIPPGFRAPPSTQGGRGGRKEGGAGKKEGWVEEREAGRGGQVAKRRWVWEP